MANSHSATFVRASSQYASVGSDLGINGTNPPVTFELWYKPTNIPTGDSENSTILHHQDAGSNVRYYISHIYNGGSPAISMNRQEELVANNVLDWTVTLSTSTWYHLVFIFSGSQIEILSAEEGGSHTSRGTFSCSGNGSGGVSSDLFRLGTNQANNSYTWAEIDDVRVWDDVRTTTELDDNFETELVGNEAGLRAYYKLNNAWTDETSNSYDLSASNSPTFTTDVPTFSSSTDYPLTAALGTFTLTGIATALSKASEMVASAGSFILTGVAASLLAGASLTAAAGSFVLTGTSTAFSKVVSLVASTGAFVLTGIAVVLTTPLKLITEVGSFILTGIETGLRPSNITKNVSKIVSSVKNITKS